MSITSVSILNGKNSITRKEVYNYFESNNYYCGDRRFEKLEHDHSFALLSVSSIFIFFILIGGCILMSADKPSCPPSDPNSFVVPYFSAVGAAQILTIIWSAITTIKKKNYLGESMNVEAVKSFLKEVKARNQEILRSGWTYNGRIFDSQKDKITKTIIGDE